MGFTYPEAIPALEGVNFAIAPGARVALLGPNGCGKSTLLKLLDGLFFATSGALTAFGQPLTEKAFENSEFAFDFRRRVGLVFQDPDVQLFSATVADDVAFGPLHMGLPPREVEEKLRWALSLLGLEKLSERPPFRLSEGEKKKVALASVIAIEPQVLLLDEPTAGLDPRSQGRLLDFLNDWHNKDRAIIVATHDLDILEEIADTAYVIGEDHRLLAEGSPQAVLGNPDFLLKANLVHEHSHFHDGSIHRHPHLHLKFHGH